MAKGFLKNMGLEIRGDSALVAKMTTVRLFIAMVVVRTWKLSHVKFANFAKLCMVSNKLLEHGLRNSLP